MIIWGLSCGFALLRYVSGLAGLLGPAAALPPRSGLRPPLHIARPIAAALHIGYSLWSSNCALKALLWPIAALKGEKGALPLKIKKAFSNPRVKESFLYH